MRIRTITRVVVLYGYLGILCFVAISVIRSGYQYVFDYDELHHAHLAYLYEQGYKPYTDIYNAVYTPLFGWVLQPILKISGFTFDAVFNARIAMITLFALRVIGGFVLTRVVFGGIAALAFLPALLFDPFTVFTSMQIRPGNLMVTAFVGSVLILTYALRGNRKHLFFLSGAMLSLSLISLLMIAPSSVVIVAILSLYLVWKRRFTHLLFFFMGFFFSWILFSSYLLLQGTFSEMVRQLFVEAYTSYTTFQYPIQVGFFYGPNNSYIYGLPGKPLTWIYTWVLPLFAFAGVFTTLKTMLTQRVFQTRDVIRTMLGLSLAGQWLWLFFLPSVFIQHYIPITWLMALFAAVSIQDFWEAIRKTPWSLRVTFRVGLVIVYVILARTSIQANNVRATIDNRGVIESVSRRWRQIPEGQYSFPNYFFRPHAYPVPYGYPLANVTPEVLARYPKIHDILERYKIRYILLDEYVRNFLQPDTLIYINKHYKADKDDPILFIRMD